MLVSYPEDLDPQHLYFSDCDLEESERVILRWSQEVHFSSVIRFNKSCCCVKDHQLLPLNPVLIDDVMKVGGWVKNVPISDSCNFAVISPALSIAALVIRNIHPKVSHGGSKQALARLREK